MSGPSPRVEFTGGTPPAADLCIATHEAGHACIAVLYGLEVARVAILAEAGAHDVRGYVLGGHDSWSAMEADRYVRDHFEQLPVITSRLPEHLHVLAAGALAEERLVGHRMDSWTDELHMEALIAKALRRAPWSKPVQQYKWAIAAVTRTQVEKNWGWITRVADALLERGSLVAADVHRLRY